MSAIPQNTAPTLQQTPTPSTQERILTRCTGRTLLLYPYLDEAMEDIMCLSSELADVCQRDLQARVWIARHTGALKLRLT